MVIAVINKNATDLDAASRTRNKLGYTEIHRVDVDANAAGHASWKWNRIDLHTHLFTDEAPDGELRDTLFHEIAHLVAGWACDEWHHGRDWRRIFADLGYPHGQVRHSMARLRGTTGKPRTRTVYVYQCKSCGHEISRRKKFNDPSLWHHRGCRDSESRYRYVTEYKETL